MGRFNVAVRAFSLYSRHTELTRKVQTFLQFSPLTVLVFLLFVGQRASGQIRVYENGQSTLRGIEASLHVDSPGRRKIDLAGTWTYSTDNETWKDVKVPSSFDYRGRLTFLRKFTIDEATLKSAAIELVALGINHDAEVYINDVFVGKHVGGYTTMQVSLPENSLQLGSENTIKIIATNTLSARSTLPLRKQIWGWRNYGGILRDIYLLATPKLWIDRVLAHSSLSGDLTQGTVNVTATLTSKVADAAGDTLNTLLRSAQVLFALELLDRNSGSVMGQSSAQPVSILPNRDHEVQSSLSVPSPRLWSPESPDLYTLKARLFLQLGKQVRVIDEFERLIGFRRIDVAKSLLVINGKPAVLKGVVWHEDSPSRGASLTYEQMEKDIVLIKTMGANAIRFAFHPPHPHLLNLCSRYGLFALLEIPAWNVPAEILDQESFQVLAEGMTAEMVERDVHQPSVLAWGIGDDFDSGDQRARGYVERMIAAVRKLDDRPVYFGSRMLTGDVCSDQVDIAAVKLRAEDAKSFKSSILRWKNDHPSQPVMVLAYGKDVQPNNRNGWSDPMSQQAQARFFERFYAVVKEANIAGSFIDSFADWRGDRPLLSVNNGNPYVHPVGLVSFAREKRVAYETVRTLYNGEKTTALPIGRYRASFPIAHIVCGFVVIFVLAYLYHYNRRFNETFKRALLRSYNFYADLRDVRIASIPQTLIVAVAVSVTLGVVLSGILYRYRTDTFADYVLTQIFVSDALKERLISAAWNPFEGILAFSIVLLAWYPITAALIKLFSMLVKTRVYWYHAFAIAVWGSLPLVLLSPLGMALFKLLETDFYVLPTFLIILAFLLWTFLRVLKGASVIYDISRSKAYAGGIAVTVLAAAGLFIYYESSYAITAYVQLIIHMARSLG